MNNRLHVLFRGSLTSCNYGCHYCPFALRRETVEEQRQDQAGLRAFVDWIKAQEHREWGILFTPWGEALVRSWYREAMVELSHLPHVSRVACQTNLSCSLKWLRNANRKALALWVSFHPTQCTLERFVNRIKRLTDDGIRLSVGAVGIREHFGLLEELRNALPSEIYFWINAHKSDGQSYTEDEVKFLKGLDPLVEWNLHRYPSLGEGCHAGETSFTVDGRGDMRRCHFIDSVVGNIADKGWEAALRERKCSNDTCGCHIGYVNLKKLGLSRTYGEGLLERIPVDRSPPPTPAVRKYLTRSKDS